MACDVNCKRCNSIEGDNIQISGLSVNPNPAKPGDPVSISLTITNSSLIGALTTVVCLYDTSNPTAPNCLISGVYELGVHQSKDVRFDNIFNMGFKSRNLNISVNVRFATWTVCNDFVDFIVDVYSPPGSARYDCAGNQCVPIDGGRFLTSNCDNSCTGGGGGTGCPDCDLTKNICLLGNCVDRQTVFLAAGAIVLYMFLNR